MASDHWMSKRTPATHPLLPSLCTCFPSSLSRSHAASISLPGPLADQLGRGRQVSRRTNLHSPREERCLDALSWPFSNPYPCFFSGPPRPHHLPSFQSRPRPCLLPPPFPSSPCSTAVGNPELSVTSMWVRMGSQFAIYILYAWILIAPAVCPNRDFS